MKIIIITDTLTSAIANQARAIIQHNKDIEFKLMSFHPKKPGGEIEALRKVWDWADLIDVQYWKSGKKIREVLPQLWDKKHKILTHHNPYNLHEEKWGDYAQIVTMNNYQKSELPNSILIPHTIDLNFFKPNPGKYTDEKVVQMCVARIENSKGVLEIARACNELQYKFILVGRISKMEYFEEAKKAGGKYFDFRHNVSDKDMRESYYQSAIHVCNSKPMFESGTLPILEAMACGTPVLTQKIGHTPDIYNSDKPNLQFFESPYNDAEGIKKELKSLMENKEKRIELKTNAAEFIKTRDNSVKAKMYRELYNKILKK